VGSGLREGALVLCVTPALSRSSARSTARRERGERRVERVAIFRSTRTRAFPSVDRARKCIRARVLKPFEKPLLVCERHASRRAADPRNVARNSGPGPCRRPPSITPSRHARVGPVTRQCLSFTGRITSARRVVCRNDFCFRCDAPQMDIFVTQSACTFFLTLRRRTNPPLRRAAGKRSRFQSTESTARG
jgi:hypothetical protein